MSDMDSGLSDVELLSQAIEADKAPAPAPEPATTQPPQVTPDQPAAPADEAPDLFDGSNIDLSNLSPAEELRMRQMQAHFTRKTQEIAEQRKAFGDVDPAQAAEALQFVNALQNDPNYALQVHNELTQALMQAGLTPQQAAVQASQQINEAMDDGEQEWDWDEPAPEYRVPPEVQQQLNELQAWKAQQEQESQRQYYAQELSRQEAAIRENDKSLTAADMDTIYGLAFAYDGDLVQAHQAFQAERNRIITSYLQEKAQVPAATPASSAGATQVQPGLTFDQAHEAAMEDIRQMQAQGLL